MRGIANTFGDEVNTDVITPSEYITESIEVLARHVFEPIDPTFADDVRDEDVIIVAGKHFGSGSSRETAPAAIQEAGVKAVVAESFSRIFYRNSINIGLPVIVSPGISAVVSDGDEIELDVEGGTVRNVSTGESVESNPLPEEIQGILESGGLLQQYNSDPDRPWADR